MSELPKEWAELDTKALKEKLEEGNIDIKILNELVKSEDSQIRLEIASAANIPEKILNILKEDEDEEVLDAVLFRELTDKWRKPPTYYLLRALHKEEPIEEKELEILSKCSDIDIRRAICLHNSTPISVLEKLKNDQDIRIKSLAELRFLLPKWDLKDKIIETEVINKEALEILSTYNGGLLTSVEFGYDNGEFKIAVALSQSTPESIIKRLKNDDNEDVVDAVLFRKLPLKWRKLTNEQKAKKLKIKRFSDIGTDALEIFLKCNNSEIKKAIAQNKNVSKDILNKLSKPDKKTLIKSWGTGIMLCLYEISKEDYYFNSREIL